MTWKFLNFTLHVWIVRKWHENKIFVNHTCLPKIFPNFFVFTRNCSFVKFLLELVLNENKIFFIYTTLMPAKWTLKLLQMGLPLMFCFHKKIKFLREEKFGVLHLFHAIIGQPNRLLYLTIKYYKII